MTMHFLMYSNEKVQKSLTEELGEGPSPRYGAILAVFTNERDARKACMAKFDDHCNEKKLDLKFQNSSLRIFFLEGVLPFGLGWLRLATSREFNWERPQRKCTESSVGK